MTNNKRYQLTQDNYDNPNLSNVYALDVCDCYYPNGIFANSAENGNH